MLANKLTKILLVLLFAFAGLANNPIQTRPQNVSLTKFVKSYWSNVSNGNYKTAWNQLSVDFQRRNHNGSYKNYLQGYKDLKICSIKVTDARLVYQTNVDGVVAVTLLYKNGHKCTSNTYQFDHYIIYESDRHQWSLNKVLTRRAGVSDAQMKQVRSIDVKLVSGTINEAQAKQELSRVSKSIGKDGLAWIVKNIPVYDDGEWMLFDDVVRRDYTKYGVDPNSRLGQDPVGTSIDLLLDDPSPSEMLDWLGFGD